MGDLRLLYGDRTGPAGQRHLLQPLRRRGHSAAGRLPVVYQNQIMGAVYAYEYDTEQAELLQGLPDQYLRISRSGGPVGAVPQRLLSRMFTRPISELLRPSAGAGGAYSHRAKVPGATRSPSRPGSSTASPTAPAHGERPPPFVSDASHELKTPLAAIRLLTDSILQTENMNAETTREFVADIGEEAQRLTRITEDLLRLTRLDSGAAAEPAPVAVAPVLRRVVRMLAVVAREQETTLLLRGGRVRRGAGHRGRSAPNLYNPMENGIKYSGHMGFVHTALTVEGGDVVIRVEDNGVGISDEDMPHIFERFYRVDKARSREVGGTGLGLSIVSDTVRRRGGTVSVAHRPAGQGTLFTVRLPPGHREEGGAHEAASRSSADIFCPAGPHRLRWPSSDGPHLLLYYPAPSGGSPGGDAIVSHSVDGPPTAPLPAEQQVPGGILLLEDSADGSLESPILPAPGCWPVRPPPALRGWISPAPTASCPAWSSPLPTTA